ncbi:hypothetical protein SAMN02927895_00025 [Belnapia rosea]|nr:hypothetical protein SAMN02927895_00025 [Belnapia rosea]
MQTSRQNSCGAIQPHMTSTDEFGPSARFLDLAGREFCRRSPHRLHGGTLKPQLQPRELHGDPGFADQPVQDRLWCAGWCEKTEIDQGTIAREAAFRDGRHLRRLGAALHAYHVQQKLDEEMAGRTRTGRGVGDAGGLGLCRGDQLREAAPRCGGVDADENLSGGQQSDRREATLDIIGQPVIQCRCHRIGTIGGDCDGVAIRPRARVVPCPACHSHPRGCRSELAGQGRSPCVERAAVQVYRYRPRHRRARSA